MAYTLFFSYKAELELNAAIDWYDDQSPRLGGRFRFLVDRQLQLVCSNPFAYKIRRKGLRGVAMKKFPFILIFKISDSPEVIEIISVFHTKRNPRRK